MSSSSYCSGNNFICFNSIMAHSIRMELGWLGFVVLFANHSEHANPDVILQLQNCFLYP